METSDDELEMTPLKRIKKNSNLLVAVNTKKTFTEESIKPKTILKKGKENAVNQNLKRKIKSNLERNTSNPINFFSPSKRFSSLNNRSAGPFISVTQPPLLSMKYGKCPVCIIDLNFIHGTTPQAHINKCLDLDPKFENGFCPGGSTCFLSNELHFRQYKHSTVEKLDVKINVKEDSRDILESQESLESAFKDYETEIESKEVATSEEVLQEKIVVSEKSVNSHKMNQSKISNFFKSTRPQECSVRKEPSSADQTNGKSEKLPVEKKPNDMIDKLNGYKMKKEAKPKRQNRRKECPFYKKIPGTGITVDAFRYGDIVGCTCYFLSHFHSDHYGGLSKHFQGKLYCSKITGNLVISELKVQSSCVVTLPMNQAVEIENFKVTLLDANHCPGSVMFLFELSNNQRILHVGDFRADVSMLDYVSLTSKRLNVIYLDTTYCNPRYCFPPQHMTTELVKAIAKQFLEKNPRTLIVVGTYTIGKERVFQAIVDSLDLDKIAVSKNKLRVLKCLEDPLLSSKLTLDYNAAQLHILPMMYLTVPKLQQHLASHNVNGRYDHILAFKPTGWTFSDKMTSLDNIKPVVRGAVTLYGIPYSEHSSFDELKWFISTLKPCKIIPTVNIGSKDSRDQMEKHFKEWLAI